MINAKKYINKFTGILFYKKSILLLFNLSGHSFLLIEYTNSKYFYT